MSDHSEVPPSCPGTPRRRPIVICGLPRSGTTWTLQTLASSPEAHRTFEPDNEEWHPAAIHAKHRLGRYPALVQHEVSKPYRRLWEWIFHGAHENHRSDLALRLLYPGRKTRSFDDRLDPMGRMAGFIARDPLPTRGTRREEPQRVIAKSIHAQLALEWLASEFEFDLLVLLRHPANVLASWLGMNLKDSHNRALENHPVVRARYLEPWGVPLPGADQIERMCWKIGLLTAALETAISRNPTWHVRVHEELCIDPLAQFRSLFDEMELEWTDATERYLLKHDLPGSGFTVNRNARSLPSAWQNKLDESQVKTLRRMLDLFPISRWDDADFNRKLTAD